MRWTEEQLADYQRGRAVRQPAAAPVKKKRTKFGNIRCQSSDGKNFASKLERDYYEQLLLRWKAGEVLWFVRQPRFDLEGDVVYVADFLVVDSRGDVSVIDTKGHLPQDCANKLKQVRARWGIEVQLVRSV